MAENKTTSTKHIESDDTVARARGFWDKYSRPIIIAGSIIILGILAWYGYREFILKPKEKKANEMMFAAEALFEKMASNSGFNRDTSIFVLNGNKDMDVTGVIKVIKDYSGTKSANRANYIAGATYLHLKEFQKAIKYLEDFEGDGAHQVKSKAYIMLGHAHAELNKTSDALEYYKKASTVNTKDDGITADALYVAASYADAIGKTKEAIDLFTRLKTDFPAYVSVKSGDIDKYLARLGVLK